MDTHASTHCSATRRGLAHLKCAISHLYSALQEAVDLSAQNISAGAQTELSKGAAQWETRVGAAFATAHGAGTYVQLASHQLVGILLLLYVRKDHVDACEWLRTDAAGTGILGVLGNKGAVAVSIGLHGSSICILNAHMAHGHANEDARNLEFGLVQQRLRFAPSEAEARHVDAESPSTVGEHEFVIWLGEIATWKARVRATWTPISARRRAFSEYRARVWSSCAR